MEYRRRQRRRRRAANGAGKTIAALVAAAAVIYVVSASAVGTWLAQNVMAPAFAAVETALIGKKDQNQQSGNQGDGQLVVNAGTSAGQQQTKQMELPGLTCYLLQMGVYSKRSNAEVQAETIRSRGAGGYILEDEGRYRVIASGYDTEESLASVREQLEQEGFETAGYTLTTAGAAFQVTAGTEQLEDIEQAFQTLKTVQKSLSELAIAFDRDTMSANEGRIKAEEVLSELRSASARLDAIGESAVLDPMRDCYADCIAALEELCANDTESFVDFSAEIKYTQLQVTNDYVTLVEALAAPA